MRMSLIGLAARNTLRHRVRSGLTAGMVVFGVALLLIALSWVDGIFGKMLAEVADTGGHVRIVNPAYAAKEELMPLSDDIPDTAPLTALLEKQPGVTAVFPRITSGVTVTVGDEIGDVFALAVGAPERWLREYAKGKEKLVRGAWFDGRPDELVMGEKVAGRTGAKIGDEVVLLGMTQDGALSPIKGRLVGITGGSAALEQQVLVPLERMRWLTDIPKGATELLVYGERYQDAPKLAKELSALPALKAYRLQPWSERGALAGLMQTVDGIRNVIVFVIVFLAALGIWNTMVMSVLERTHEIGVLRAMGLGRMGAVGLFVLEAMSIGVVGGLVGVGLGAVPAWLLATKGIHLGAETVERVSATIPITETVYGTLNVHIVLTAFVLGLVMALLGSLLPAFRAASIQPVSAMRSGR